MAASLRRVFQRFPIGAPIVSLLIGGAILLITRNPQGVTVLYPRFAAIALLIVGIVALPAGIVGETRRRLNPVILTCPSCGMESRNAPTPFFVERLGHVDYAVVKCSNCNEDFTVDKRARLL